MVDPLRKLLRAEAQRQRRKRNHSAAIHLPESSGQNNFTLREEPVRSRDVSPEIELPAHSQHPKIQEPSPHKRAKRSHSERLNAPNRLPRKSDSQGPASAGKYDSGVSKLVNEGTYCKVKRRVRYYHSDR